MKVYHYHSETGEFLGEGVARRDPLDGGRYLVPGYATDQAPPKAGAGQVAVHTGGEWQVLQDNRGAVYWTPEGARVEIEAIGDAVPPDAMDAPPKPSATDPGKADLSPVQFAYLLAKTGFGDIWQAMENQAKAGGDLETYASLRAERARSRFNLERTLGMVAAFRDLSNAVSDADLSNEAVRAAWREATQFKGTAG
jgi:hypothetical protein